MEAVSYGRYWLTASPGKKIFLLTLLVVDSTLLSGEVLLKSVEAGSGPDNFLTANGLNNLLQQLLFYPETGFS
jgi:hypothetical protein